MSPYRKIAQGLIEELPEEKLKEAIEVLEKIKSEGHAYFTIKPRQVAPKDRRLEMQWVEAHREQYAGRWVALDGETLISHGPNAKEVFEEADRSGVERPLVIQIEPQDTLPFAGW